MAEAKSLNDLMQIRAHNRDFIDSINGTLGTALGFKKKSREDLTCQPAIIVFVPMKINPKWIPGSQMIPKKLEGPDGLWCALDVVEGGKAKIEDPVPESSSELAERLRGWDDKIWSGSQVSHWVDQANGSYSMGTLGAFTKKRESGVLGFLTNMHVGIEQGQKLFHPVPWGTHIGTTAETIEYVKDDQWYGPLIDEETALIRADCAFVDLDPEFNPDNITPDMMGVGKLGPVKDISLDDMSIIGQRVLRVGRTTGLRRGSVVAFGYEYIDDSDVKVYTDLLIIGDNNIPFSTHGDSGSLIVTDDFEHNPIGLLWGGWLEKLRTGYAQENWTYGTALTRILDALEIDLI